MQVIKQIVRTVTTAGPYQRVDIVALQRTNQLVAAPGRRPGKVAVILGGSAFRNLPSQTRSAPPSPRQFWKVRPVTPEQTA